MGYLKFSIEDVFMQLPRRINYSEYHFLNTLYGFYGVIGLEDNTYITSDDITKILLQLPIEDITLEKACAVCSDIINDAIKKEA